MGNGPRPASGKGKVSLAMNFGFNSNVRVAEAMYHVQTEDRGVAHPFLDTVVYLSGRVIHKRSTSYALFAMGVDPEVLAQKLHERLAQQHREVIAELEAGTLAVGSEKRELPAEAAPIVQESLELRLLNPKSCFAAGNAVLELELREKDSKRGIGDAEVQACMEQEKQRIPCAEQHTDAAGRATLKFPMPPNVAEGAWLVVRARDGARYGDLRFRLKVKAREKAPEPVSR